MKGDRKSPLGVEDALRETERRLQDILDNTTAVIYVKDVEGRYLLINSQYERLFHVARDQIVGKTDYDIFPKEMADAFRANDLKVLEANRNLEFEEVAPQDDGLHTYVSVKFPLRDSRGVAYAVCGISTDITERKREQDALRKARDELERRVQERTEELRRANEDLRAEIAGRRKAEEEYKAILRSAMDGFWIIDTRGHILDVSEAYCRLTGYNREELLGKHVQYVEAAETPEETAEHIRRIVEKGSDRFETRQRRKDGTIVDVEVSVNYLPWEAGRLFAFHRDITQRKRAEEERERLLREIEGLAEAAQRRAAELQGVLDNMIDGVYVCDAEGRITLVNEAGLKLLGMSDVAEPKRALAVFPEMFRIRHPDGRPRTPEQLPLARALGGEIVSLEDEIVFNLRTHKDVHLRTSAAPIKDEKGRIVGAVEVARDVTELTEVDRLKEEFISVAAHELKTPVAIMKAYAQALLRTAADIPAPRRKMLEAINRGSDRIDRIVGDLLDISRLLAGRLELSIESIDLPQMVEDVVDRLALTTTKHRIRVVSTEAVVVRGDRDRLEQVVINMVDNAIKYSPRGGDIDVAVGVRDHEAVVSVRDQGVGIPRDKQKHIFERFYRAHTGTPYDYGGMGVGLFISREIISRHGGRMWFESQEGVGSTFYFSLPLRGEDAGR